MRKMQSVSLRMLRAENAKDAFKLAGGSILAGRKNTVLSDHDYLIQDPAWGAKPVSGHALCWRDAGAPHGGSRKPE